MRREQEEVLQIFSRIHKETGWRIGFIPKDLSEKWGWNLESSPSLPTHAQPHAGHANLPSHYASTNFDGSPAMASQTSIASQYDQYGEMQRMIQQQQAQQLQQVQHASLQPSPLGMNTPAPHQVPQAPKPSRNSVTPQRKAPPQGIVNPMFAAADFAMPKHPYQEYYVAPSHQYQHHAGNSQGGLGLGLYQGSGFPPGGGAPY